MRQIQHVLYENLNITFEYKAILQVLYLQLAGQYYRRGSRGNSLVEMIL